MTNLVINSSNTGKLTKKELTDARRPVIHENSFPLFSYDFRFHDLLNRFSSVDINNGDTLELNTNIDMFYKRTKCLYIRRYGVIKNPYKIHSLKGMNKNQFSFSTNFLEKLDSLKVFYLIYHDRWNHISLHVVTGIAGELRYDQVTVTFKSSSDTSTFTLATETEIIFKGPLNKSIFKNNYDNQHINHLQFTYNFEDTTSQLACSTNDFCAVYLNGVRLIPTNYKLVIFRNVYPTFTPMGYPYNNSYECRHSFPSKTDFNLKSELDSFTDQDFWNRKFDPSNDPSYIPSRYPEAPNYYENTASLDNWDKFVDVHRGEIFMYNMAAYNSVYKIK